MGSSSDLNCFPNRGRPQFGQSPRFVGLNSHVCPQYTPLTSAVLSYQTYWDMVCDTNMWGQCIALLKIQFYQLEY